MMQTECQQLEQHNTTIYKDMMGLFITGTTYGDVDCILIGRVDEV